MQRSDRKINHAREERQRRRCAHLPGVLPSVYATTYAPRDDAGKGPRKGERVDPIEAARIVKKGRNKATRISETAKLRSRETHDEERQGDAFRVYRGDSPPRGRVCSGIARLAAIDNAGIRSNIEAG